MSTLTHEGHAVSTVHGDWQTQARGTNYNEYQIYLSCAQDKTTGLDITTGLTMKSYEEWLQS